jgi:hypothetical protein
MRASVRRRFPLENQDKKTIEHTTHAPPWRRPLRSPPPSRRAAYPHALSATASVASEFLDATNGAVPSAAKSGAGRGYGREYFPLAAVVGQVIGARFCCLPGLPLIAWGLLLVVVSPVVARGISSNGRMAHFIACGVSEIYSVNWHWHCFHSVL